MRNPDHGHQQRQGQPVGRSGGIGCESGQAGQRESEAGAGRQPAHGLSGLWKAGLRVGVRRLEVCDDGGQEQEVGAAHGLDCDRPLRSTGRHETGGDLEPVER